MIRHTRRKVVSFELRRPFPTWPESRHAILECGHVHNLGNTNYAPALMACHECPGSREVGKAARGRPLDRSDALGVLRTELPSREPDNHG